MGMALSHKLLDDMRASATKYGFVIFVNLLAVRYTIAYNINMLKIFIGSEYDDESCEYKNL